MPTNESGAAQMERSWLACAIRNRLEEIAAEEKTRPVVVQMPNDPNSLLVLQRGGNHLLVTVQKVDVSPYG